MREGRLPPAGRPYSLRELRRLTNAAPTRADLSHRLALRLGANGIRLLRSGREALRVGLTLAARDTGRAEVLIPAYTCYSVAAAAVAAGLRIRLVDVDEHGRIDGSALAATPLANVAAIVVCNLFGRAEPIAQTRALASAAGCWVIDDAAQSFGATLAHDPSSGEPTNAIGGRADLGVLSFGRGKPLSGLGGGALVFSQREDKLPIEVGEPTGGRAGALLRAAAYDIALVPQVFGLLSSIPALGIGETHFEPHFERGGIDASAMILTAQALGATAAERDVREAQALRLAADLERETEMRPIVASGGERAVYPRLFVLAANADARNAALAHLDGEGAGASVFYPQSLDEVPGLAPHRMESAPMVGGRTLAERLFTLPVHGRLEGVRWQRCLARLSEVRPACDEV